MEHRHALEAYEGHRAVAETSAKEVDPVGTNDHAMVLATCRWLVDEPLLKTASVLRQRSETSRCTWVNHHPTRFSSDAERQALTRLYQ